MLFTDFFRTIVFADSDFGPIKDNAPFIWLGLKMHFYPDLKDYIKANNITLKKDEHDKNNQSTLTSWSPFDWFNNVFSMQSDYGAYKPILETKEDKKNV